MGRLATTLHAANAALLTDRNDDAIAEHFATDYVVHLTDGDQRGGHRFVRDVLGMLRRAFPDL